MAEYTRRKRRKPKRKMRKGCFVSLISFALILTSVIIMFLTPVFNINKINVKGNTRVNSQVVISLSGIKHGDNIFSANYQNAKKKISSMQYVENVKIIKKYPDTVEIQITEGKVSAYIQSGDKTVGINSEGQVLCNISNMGSPTDAPTVTGLSVTEGKIGKIVKIEEEKKFEILLKFLKTFKKNDVAAKITHFDITDDDYIVFCYEDKLKVEFGDINHYENKFDYLFGFINHMAETPEGIVNMVSDNYTYRPVIS